jgi:DNA-binding CsgD family transcriptional regulator
VFPAEVWRLLVRSLELSQRESEIVRAVLADQKESAIALDLGISPHTVHTYLERMYRKLGVSSRVTLVSRVFLEYLWLQQGNGVTRSTERSGR